MKLPFASEAEIKTFSEKLKLRHFIATSPSLKETLKRSSSERRKSDIGQKLGSTIVKEEHRKRVSESKNETCYVSYS